MLWIPKHWNLEALRFIGVSWAWYFVISCRPFFSDASLVASRFCGFSGFRCSDSKNLQISTFEETLNMSKLVNTIFKTLIFEVLRLERFGTFKSLGFCNFESCTNPKTNKLTSLLLCVVVASSLADESVNKFPKQSLPVGVITVLC